MGKKVAGLEVGVAVREGAEGTASAEGVEGLEAYEEAAEAAPRPI